MTRLPLLALILAGSAAAMPAGAQEATVEGEKINQVIVYGSDKCEQSSPDEIVVCNRLPEQDRYRVPQMFRGGDPLDPRNNAWANRVVALERVGRFGTDSCSPTGLGGFTGCTQQLVGQYVAEKESLGNVRAGQLVSAEREKRLAELDAEAAEEQAKVDALIAEQERTRAERDGAASPTEEPPVTQEDLPLP